jgi:hypothetical protein
MNPPVPIAQPTAATPVPRAERSAGSQALRDAITFAETWALRTREATQ